MDRNIPWRLNYAPRNALPVRGHTVSQRLFGSCDAARILTLFYRRVIQRYLLPPRIYRCTFAPHGRSYATLPSTQLAITVTCRDTA